MRRDRREWSWRRARYTFHYRGAELVTPWILNPCRALDPIRRRRPTDHPLRTRRQLQLSIDADVVDPARHHAAFCERRLQIVSSRLGFIASPGGPPMEPRTPPAPLTRRPGDTRFIRDSAGSPRTGAREDPMSPKKGAGRQCTRSAALSERAFV